MSFRRIVTGHDAQGRAVILEDGPPPRVQRIGGPHGPLFFEVWNTRQTPAHIDAASGEPHEDGIQLAPPPHGTRIRVLEVPPEDASIATLTPEEARAHFAEVGAAEAASHKGGGSKHAFMHRTETIDYGIVLEGEITLILDEGETVARAGDIVIQRGTNHGWANRGTVPCRIAFILIDGKYDAGAGTVKLATAQDGSPDGQLLIVSRDQQHAVVASTIAPTLQQALERWDTVAPALQALSDALNAGKALLAKPLNSWTLLAPLPRAWQWLDGSAFATHGDLMAEAFHQPPIDTKLPLMYQGLSHTFFAPTQDVPFLREEDGIDFEGEFGILTSSVPMGTTAAEAMQHIRLLVQINDWSLRRLAPAEMKTGFGWIQAKPACSMAPFALTPDELGALWSNARVQATLEVWRNDERFGAVPATDMQWGFDDLVAHAAATRALCAGTVIGSGTVSHPGYRELGSCCIAERRAIEMIDNGGTATTSYLRFGETVRMLVPGKDKSLPLFGSIDQKVVQA